MDTPTGVRSEKLLLREPLPCTTAAENPHKPVIWYFTCLEKVV